MPTKRAQEPREAADRRRSLALQRRMLDEDRVGTTCHRALAWLLTYDLPLDEPHAVAATDAMIGRAVSPVYRASLRAWVSGAVTRYRSRFLRGAAWRFVGAELIVGEVALDLLWAGPAGRLQVDELKTGLRPAGRIRQSLAQATLQAQFAAATLGPCFEGVRLVVLNDPGLSVLVLPDGSTRPIQMDARE